LRPLYGARNPSLVWQGGFYVPRRGLDQLCPEPFDYAQDALVKGWTLRLEYMHSIAQNNTVLLNDQLLGYLPARDNAPTWMSVAFPVPAGLLRPGYNELTVEVSRLAPDYQTSDFTWGDVQFRRVRLERR
jgi:hypothetical protein